MKKRVKTIDFEIGFYEKVLERSPHFVEALSAIGDLYTKKGRYEEGLSVDEKLSQLRPDDPVVLYNLACSYSLVGEVDKSFRTIKKAVNCGYDDFEFIAQDTDLENLHKDRRFQRYFSRLKAKSDKANGPDADRRKEARDEKLP